MSNQMNKIAIAATIAAFSSSMAAAAAQLSDGRAYKRARKETYTIRNDTWKTADSNNLEDGSSGYYVFGSIRLTKLLH